MAIDCVGIEAVTSRFEAFKNYGNHAVFEDTKEKDLKYKFDGNDFLASKKVFLECCHALIQQNCSALFICQFYDDPLKMTKIQKGSSHDGSFRFRLVQDDLSPRALGAIGAALPAANNQFVDYLQKQLDEKNQIIASQVNEISELKNEISELEDELDEATRADAGDDDKLGVIGTIGKAGEKFPWMQEILKDGMTVVKHMFNRHQQPPPSRAMGNAAPPPPPPQTDQRPDQAITAAMQHLLQGYYFRLTGMPEGEESSKVAMAFFAQDMVLMARVSDDAELFDLLRKKLKNMG